MHPSFEDRPGAPDRVFASLVTRGRRTHRAGLDRGSSPARGRRRPRSLHLHHLTPIHDAATALFPDTPLVTHLHGTEILLLEQIDRLSAIARLLGTDLAGMAGRAPGRLGGGRGPDPG